MIPPSNEDLAQIARFEKEADERGLGDRNFRIALGFMLGLLVNQCGSETVLWYVRETLNFIDEVKRLESQVRSTT